MGDSFIESSQSLPQRAMVRGFARVVDEKKLPELTAELLTDSFGHPFDLAGQLFISWSMQLASLARGNSCLRLFLVLLNPSVSIPKA